MQNFSATNGNFSTLTNVNLSVNGTADSISTTSGSIVSSGGIGVAKTLYANGINAISITGTSLIGGNLFSGTSFTGTSAYFTSITGTNVYASQITGVSAFFNTITGVNLYSVAITGTTAYIGTILGENKTQLTNDTIYVGNTTAQTNFFIDRNCAGGQINIGYNTAKHTSFAQPFSVYNNSTDRLALLACGAAGSSSGNNYVKSYITDDSTSTTTGALQILGGAGIAKTLYANGINAVAITGTYVSASQITGVSAFFNTITGINEFIQSMQSGDISGKTPFTYLTSNYRDVTMVAGIYLFTTNISNDGKFLLSHSNYFSNYTGANLYSQNGGSSWYQLTGYTFGGTGYMIDGSTEMSQDGKYVIGTVAENTAYGGIYVSNDYGTILNQKISYPNITGFTASAISGDNSTMITFVQASGPNSCQCFISRNYGETWTQKTPEVTITATVTSKLSYDGNIVVTAGATGAYISRYGGTGWTYLVDSNSWESEIGMSDNGNYIYVGDQYSYDGGLSFKTLSSQVVAPYSWVHHGISCDSTGKYVAAAYCGPPSNAGCTGWFSNDYGKTWLSLVPSVDRTWNTNAIVSRNGKYIVFNDYYNPQVVRIFTNTNAQSSVANVDAIYTDRVISNNTVSGNLITANSINGNAITGSTTYAQKFYLNGDYVSTRPTTQSVINAISTWTGSTSMSAAGTITWCPEFGRFITARRNTTVALESVSGKAWTSHTCPTGIWVYSCFSPQLGIAVMAANDNGGVNPNFMYSSDGISWTSSTMVGQTPNSICWSPELGLFCALSSADSKYFISSNGTTWTSGSTGVAISNIMWSPELRIFAGVGTSVSGKSTNGTSWTSASTSVYPTIFAAGTSCAWIREFQQFRGINSTGYSCYSSDGLTWVTLSNSLPVEVYSGFCWCSDLHICILSSNYVSANFVYSFDMINWASVSSGGGNCNQCVWSRELGLFVYNSPYNDGDCAFYSNYVGKYQYNMPAPQCVYPSTAPSTSTTTGALVVAGGVGVGGTVSATYVAAGSSGVYASGGISSSAGITATGILQVSSANVNCCIKALNSGRSTGQITEIEIGVSEADKNCAEIGFDFAGGAGSDSNNVRIGVYNNAGTLRVYPNGIVINGTITKSGGSFLINHPDPAKSGWKLRHCFVESNTRGTNLYEYEVQTSNLTYSIQLPNYFKYLNERPYVYISAKNVLGYGYGVVDDQLENVTINVSNDGIYYVMVTGVRKDQLMKDYWDECKEEIPPKS